MRDHRRITRAKQTTHEWRDMVDLIPEDLTIRQAADADYRYIGIDTTDLDVAGTVQRIKGAIPEIYADEPLHANALFCREAGCSYGDGTPRTAGTGQWPVKCASRRSRKLRSPSAAS